MFNILRLDVRVLWVQHPVRLDPLRARLVIEVVFAVESLVSLDSLFELELDFREIWTEFQRNFVNEL